MTNQTRFMYLRDNNNQPVGCLAVQYDKDSGSTSYQVSTLNPHDRFDRARGRTIAEARLAKRPKSLTVQAKTLHEVYRAVLENLKADKEFPLRTVEAAKAWLNVKLNDKT